jgi:hypothetical protein
MPVFEVFADDTIKSYRNNESKFEVDPDNNRIRLRDDVYISGSLTITGGLQFALPGSELTESNDATDDKILLWDESVDTWKYMTLDNLQDSIDTGGGGAVTAVANGSDNRVATFTSSTALNGESSLTYDGSDLSIARRLSHWGDSDTYIAFDTDNIKLHSHGVDFLEVSEGSTDELIVNPGEVDVNFRVKGNSRDELLFADAGNDRVGVLTSAPTTSFQVNGTMYISGNSTMRGNVEPQADDSFYLGASDKTWKNGYFQNLRLAGLSNDATAVGSTTRFLVEGGSNEVEYQLGNEIIYSISATFSDVAMVHGDSTTLTLSINGSTVATAGNNDFSINAS